MSPTLIAIWSAAPRSGKSSVARIITEEFPQYELRSFADPVKAMARTLLDFSGVDERAISEALHGDKVAPLTDIPGSPNGRQLLVGIGNGFGRAMNPDFWASLLERRLWKDLRPTVIDDLRFPEELNMVRRCGGQVWEVTRPGVQPVNQRLCRADVELTNDGSLNHLRRQVQSILSPSDGGE